MQLLQDEYRWVDSVTEMMRHLGIDVLLSIVPEDQIAAVYGDSLPDTEILPTLAGYVPRSYRSIPCRRSPAGPSTSAIADARSRSGMAG